MKKKIVDYVPLNVAGGRFAIEADALYTAMAVEAVIARKDNEIQGLHAEIAQLKVNVGVSGFSASLRDSAEDRIKARDAEIDDLEIQVSRLEAEILKAKPLSEYEVVSIDEHVEAGIIKCRRYIADGNGGAIFLMDGGEVVADISNIRSIIKLPSE